MTINKKVMTAAVAAALVAPAAAFAQASNVQIYGTFSYSGENRSAPGQDTALAPATNGSSMRGAVPATSTASVANAYATAAAPIANQANRTATQSAGSNFGVRGREDLGNGMYAGFQIEISAAPLGATPVAATTGGSILATYRNVGLWVGNRTIGEIGAGQWDSPFTMITNNTGAMHAAYGNASTSMSAGFLGTNPISPATISGQALGMWCGGTGAYAVNGGNNFTTCAAMATSFNRRIANQVWWQSPNWSGFSFRAMTTAATPDYVANNGTGPATVINELKPFMWGASATYGNGPLDVRVGYEQHKDIQAAAWRGINGVTGAATNLPIFIGGQGATASQISTTLTTVGGTGITGSNDTAWNINARYNFGQFSVGAYWESLKWNMSYLAPSTNGVGNVTKLTKTGYRLDGAWQGGPHTIGLQYGKNNNMNGGLDNNNNFEGTATGASNWIFGYAYSLSKRTNLFGYHTRTNNDTNARYGGIVFSAIATPSGADPRYTGVGIRHSF